MFSLQWEEASNIFCTRQHHKNIFGYNKKFKINLFDEQSMFDTDMRE